MLRRNDLLKSSNSKTEAPLLCTHYSTFQRMLTCRTRVTACIQSKVWHHNWIHDCYGKCARGDDNTVNLNLHHNVIFNCGMPNDDGTKTPSC